MRLENKKRREEEKIVESGQRIEDSYYIILTVNSHLSTIHYQLSIAFMNNVQKTLYFSKRHDSDLISLYHQIGRKAFVKVMKESLRVLVRAGYEPTFTKNLEFTPMLYEEAVDNDDDKSFYIVVSFSSEKDTDIADLIGKVKSRKLGAFIKNAMRLLIGPYYILGCLLEGDANLNNAYKDRKLFFVNGGMTSPSKKERKSYTRKTTQTIIQKKEIVKAEEEPQTKEYQSVQESTFVEPEIPVYQPVEIGGGEVFSDDDILSLLENM